MQLLVNLTYDQDYKGYVADVPELPGCMSQGKTVEAALKKRQGGDLAVSRGTSAEETPSHQTGDYHDRGGLGWDGCRAFPGGRRWRPSGELAFVFSGKKAATWFSASKDDPML